MSDSRKKEVLFFHTAEFLRQQLAAEAAERRLQKEEAAAAKAAEEATAKAQVAATAEGDETGARLVALEAR